MAPENVGRLQEPEEQERLIETITQLVSSRDWDEAAATVQQNHILYDPEVDMWFAELIKHSESMGYHEFAKKLPLWRDFLQICREFGIVNAVEAAGGSLVTAPESVEPLVRRAAELEQRHSAGDRTALEELVALWARVAEDPAVRRDHLLLRAVAQYNMGGALRRMPGQAARAAAVIRTAIRLLPASSAYRSAFMIGLAQALAEEHDLAGLREAVALVEEAARADPGTAALGGAALHDVGVGAHDVGEIESSLEAIDLSLTAFRLLHEGVYPDPEEPGGAASAMVQILRSRHRLSRDPDDLSKAVSMAEWAAAQVPTESAEWASRRNGLAVCLRVRYDEAGDPADLDRAIDIHRDALDRVAPDAEIRPYHLHGLGVALRRRYVARDTPEDLTLCSRAHEEMLGLVRPGDSLYSTALEGYGHTLRVLYQANGRIGDLRQAVALHREGLAYETGPGRVSMVCNLGIDLRQLYMSTGDVATLEEAIDLLREATAGRRSSTGNDTALFTLGSCLMDKYQAFGDSAVGAEAIRILEDLLAHTPENSPDREVRLGNLAAALILRHVHEPDTHAEDFLDRAERLLEEAVSRSKGLDRARHLVNLAQCVMQRSGHEKSEPGMRRLVGLMEEACALCPVEAANGAAYRINLAMGYAKLYELTEDPAALARGLGLLREASAAGVDQYPLAVMRLARGWGDQSSHRGRWDEAAETYGYALDALDRLVDESSVREHKQQWLRQAEGLAAAAAAAHVRAGDPWSAVVALERGRTRLLADALGEDAAETDRLARAHPALAEAYRSAAATLRGMQSLSLAPMPGDDRPPAHAFAEARRHREEVLLRIRSVPGFERFRLPDAARDVSNAARLGPLLYVVPGIEAGFALLVIGESVRVHALPALTWAELRPRMTRYFQDYERAATDLHRWHRALDDTTAWMWEAIMEPLLDFVPDCAELTLIPTGMIASLPLHVAWTPDAETATGRRFALDHLPLVFAPSAKARAAADRAASTAVPAPAALLAVEDPQPVAAAPLRYSRYEIDAGCARFPEGSRLTGEEASRQAVLAALDGHTVQHFACHGYADWGQVLDSYLLLAHDERLTLRDLLARPAGTRRLVVLSACETSLPHVELADEVVGIATGFLQGGAAGVIGSMWRVPDVSTALLLSRFYILWRDGAHPAEALRTAQRWLRDATNRELRSAYPEIMDRYAPIPEPLREVWGTGRDFAHPAYWAAFTYMGA